MSEMQITETPEYKQALAGALDASRIYFGILALKGRIAMQLNALLEMREALEKGKLEYDPYDPNPSVLLEAIDAALAVESSINRPQSAASD